MEKYKIILKVVSSTRETGPNNIVGKYSNFILYKIPISQKLFRKAKKKRKVFNSVHLIKILRDKLSWGYRSMVKHLPIMCKTLSLIPLLKKKVTQDIIGK
jgi:hypothetical protein